LHHNQHIHSEPADTNCNSSVEIEPLGCGAETFYYSIILKVTDAGGFSTTQEVLLFPDCQSLCPMLKFLDRDGLGAIHWQLVGDTAHLYWVEGSTNLVDWSLVTTVQPVTGVAEFDDPDAGALGFRFYRAVLVP
jgi:hypothetical protein